MPFFKPTAKMLMTWWFLECEFWQLELHFWAFNCNVTWKVYPFGCRLWYRLLQCRLYGGQWWDFFLHLHKRNQKHLPWNQFSEILARFLSEGTCLQLLCVFDAYFTPTDVRCSFCFNNENPCLDSFKVFFLRIVPLYHGINHHLGDLFTFFQAS